MEKAAYLSRKEFLKLSGLGLLGAFSPPISLPHDESSPTFGRVIDEVIQVYDAPSFSGNAVQSYSQDCILFVNETVKGDEEPAHNQDWCRIGELGYVHSALLQPVAILLNTPQQGLPAEGILAQVTVPFTDAFETPSRDEPAVFRHYYASTHWVGQLVIDKYDHPWYCVQDDRLKSRKFYVSAVHLRIFPRDELAPISPDMKVDEKRIEVRLGEQTVIAYERDYPVFVSRVSTADTHTNPKWVTPLGEYKIYYKRPSQHMASSEPSFGEYDYPGVPWICYFTEKGHAFHGVYWHNDFGKPRSHGCVNLSPKDAKWLYLWTRPSVPPDFEVLFNSTYGTTLKIVQ